MKAIRNKQIIAGSEHIILLEGNSYFPADAVNKNPPAIQSASIGLPLERNGGLL